MTNYRNTNYIVDEYRMNNNLINVEYFCHLICITCENTKHLYFDAINKSRKPESVAKNWIASFINIELECNGYNTVCTYPQIRKALAEQYNEIEKNITDYINLIRSEV